MPSLSRISQPDKKTKLVLVYPMTTGGLNRLKRRAIG